MHDTTRKLTLFLLFLPSENYATNPNGINNIEYVFVELSLGYGMKYVTESILLGQATEIGRTSGNIAVSVRDITQLTQCANQTICAILPTFTLYAITTPKCITLQKYISLCLILRKLLRVFSGKNPTGNSYSFLRIGHIHNSITQYNYGHP